MCSREMTIKYQTGKRAHMCIGGEAPQWVLAVSLSPSTFSMVLATESLSLSLWHIQQVPR